MAPHGIGLQLKRKLRTSQDGKTCFSNSEREGDATVTRFNSGDL